MLFESKEKQEVNICELGEKQGKRTELNIKES